MIFNSMEQMRNYHILIARFPFSLTNVLLNMFFSLQVNCHTPQLNRKRQVLVTFQKFSLKTVLFNFKFCCCHIKFCLTELKWDITVSQEQADLQCKCDKIVVFAESCQRTLFKQKIYFNFFYMSKYSKLSLFQKQLNLKVTSISVHVQG